jgi:hypothetical protein
MDDVFPHVYAFAVAKSGSTWINIEVFSVNADRSFSPAELRKRATELQGKLIKDDKLPERLRGHIAEPVATGDVPILTDDYAPVDALMHLW